MKRTTIQTVLAVGVAAGSTSGCYGGIGAADTGDPAPAPTSPPGSGENEPSASVPPLEPPTAEVGLMPLRRLTNDEFSNTMRDLLGDDTRPGDGMPADGDGSAGFATPGLVSTVDVRTIGEVAAGVAQRAVTDLDALLPCSPDDEQDACARSFIEHFGRRVFRRPLDEAERERAFALYEASRVELGESFEQSIGTLIEAFVQSPQLLYRWELGTADPVLEGETIRLNDYELASRLSYFLWSSTPDDALLDAAEAGELQTAAQLEQQARRMLADGRSIDMLHGFQRQWLHLEGLRSQLKDPTAYPEFDDALIQSMIDEAQAFFVHVIREGEGDLTTLLTADYSLIDDRMAGVYGVPAPGSTVPVRTPLPGRERAGILTQPAFLATHALPDLGDVIKRGVTVSERVLCLELPAPPSDVPPLPDPDPTLPQREFFDQHVDDPACAGCHDLIDPVGFGLLNYDAIGRWQDKDAGGTIDASGSFLALSTGERVSFEGPIDMVQAIANSEDAPRCFATQWFRFALLRAETEVDQTHLEAIYERFRDEGYNIEELLVAIATSDAFRFRSPSEGEVLP